MTATEVTDVEGQVLEALEEIERRHLVPTVHAAAIISRLEMGLVRDAVNALFTRGLITPSLTLTEQGRAAARS